MIQGAEGVQDSEKEGRYNVRAVVEVALTGEVCRINDGASHKSEYRIVGAGGEVLAEIRRKQTDAGVVLGDDVLSLTVGPTADRLLVVGLVVVRGLLLTVASDYIHGYIHFKIY
uniref:Uncharacterized protein n=1 Tax=Oryza meridionalis TaxID=40149 RepID=A0A0E0CCL0_9ORYZ